MIEVNKIVNDLLLQYFEYFKENKMKYSIGVVPTKEITNVLPKEAFTDNLLIATFDWSAEETWVAEQVNIEDNIFSCILVYKQDDEWTEYNVSFPMNFIVYITEIKGFKPVSNTEFSKEQMIKSRKAFKWLSGKSIQENIK